MKSQLTVYKASAGSGKTFTLAKEYLTLVIENPQAYRTILAVTFTNKATEEMKQRILSQLYGIAHRLADSNAYLEQIKKALPHLSEEIIVKNAAEALQLLIHNYNYFRVQTIDTFFQSVLRNLARELDLTANLRIGLNDYQVEQQAVDELIESLESTDRLLFWIMGYIRENMDQDKAWNVIGPIKSFGEHIFKDYYKEHADALNECMEKEGFFKEFTEKMRNLRTKAKDGLQEIAATFFDILDQEGFSADDLAGKTRGIWSYFNKLKQGKYSDDELINATFQKCYDSAEAWVKKSEAKTGAPIFNCVELQLLPLLKFSEEKRPKLVRMFKSADLTMKHLNQLRLLGSIDQKVREMNQEANRFLLSDTQTLLHSLIQDTDSPFIFEKIGTQLDHVMIDEFQDTSTIQWKNFKVLLEETMSRENAGNLIVGDVKQSIYRWRSGDWRLLNNIKQQFSQGQHTLDIQTLDTNYRSSHNVIKFNNAFFTVAAELEGNELTGSNPQEVSQLINAYADVCQKVPEGKPVQGYVDIQLLGGEATTESMMQQTLEIVKQLDDMGVPVEKIAILVRNNRTIQDIAAYFMEHSEYPMVSDEAFRLDASQAVCTLVTALQLLAHPDNNIARATLDKYAEKYLREYANKYKDKKKQKYAKYFDFTGWLLEERDNLLQMPLYELTEKLYFLLMMNKMDDMKQQSAYICAFYDQLNGYLADNSSDIEAFLQEWENNLHEKSIHCDGIKGIRLITIHKSKGLEFEHVIMPFCDWTLEKNTTIWCEPRETPYNELPLVPVDFSSKQMMQSIYEPDYHQEHLQNVVDNLNLLYVAFTRASQSLFVLGKRGKESIRSYTIENALEQVAKKLETTGVPVTLDGLGSDSKTDDICFCYGEMEITAIAKQEADKQGKKKESDNLFLKQEEPENVDIIANPNLPEFRQSNKSRDFIQGDDAEEQQKFYIRMGTVLHNVFSTIKTTDDIPEALLQMELDGVLYDDNVSREKVEAMIKRRLTSPKVKDWFSPKWKVINECTILSCSAGKLDKENRPDRVMRNDKETIVVDFKFGKPKPEHEVQVAAYMRLLQQMHYPGIKGYLWYVYPNDIVEVIP